MNTQSGSAILMLLVGVGLFGAVAYTVTQNSRSSTSAMSQEATKASVTGASDYTNDITLAVKRLKLRGCTDVQISHETPNGNNPNPAAPTDGRCHVFRTAGGGVQFTGVDPAAAPPPTGGCGVPSPAVGTVCTDGSIFAGLVGGDERFTTVADQSTGTTWTGTWASPFMPTGVVSTTNGAANTTTLAARVDTSSPYVAAKACENLVANGKTDWYLPAKDEIPLFYAGRLLIPGLSSTIYFSSTEYDNDEAWVHHVGSNAVSHQMKYNTYRSRCMRKN